MRLQDLIPTSPEPPPYVRASKVADWLGVTKATLRAWSKKGRIPKPLVLGPRIFLYEVEALRKALVRLDEEATIAGEEVSLA